MQVLSKELKEHGYYKKKGLVEKLASRYVAQTAMLDSGDVLQVGCIASQNTCEAVTSADCSLAVRVPSHSRACERMAQIAMLDSGGVLQVGIWAPAMLTRLSFNACHLVHVSSSTQSFQGSL